MPNSAPQACPSAAASQKTVAKNSSSPGSAAAGCAGNASLGRRFCNFAQSSSHNNGTAFGRMLCCKLRSSTSGGNYTLRGSLGGYTEDEVIVLIPPEDGASAYSPVASVDYLTWDQFADLLWCGAVYE